MERFKQYGVSRWWQGTFKVILSPRISWCKIRSDNSNINFNLTIPNKVHFILDHFEDYFYLAKEALGNTSDQLVEAMHQHIDVMLKKSGYWIKDFSSEY